MNKIQEAIKEVARVARESDSVYIGIDPGFSEGAWAFLADNGVRCYAEFLPLVKRKKSGKTAKGNARWETDYDLQAIREVLITLPPHRTFATIEKPMVVRAAKGSINTALTAFRTAWGGAVWPGIFSALGIKYQLVASSSWKAKTKISKLEKKDVLDIAARRWPLAFPKFRVKDHNLAEALLLASYGLDHGVNLGKEG